MKKTTRSFQKVVLRRPVPFQPDPKNPGYLLCYIQETLECGHEITVFPSDAEKLTATRRSCHRCAGCFGGLTLPKGKANVIEMRKRG